MGGQSAFMAVDHFPVPGETISCRKLFFEPGGKGYNQAIACARMGVDTVFIGAVGADAHAEACRIDLEKEGITACLIPKDIPTAFAVITTDKNAENTVCVFGGAAKALSPEDLRSDAVMQQLQNCTYLLLQNELSADCLLEACKIGQELGIPVIFNPAPAEPVVPKAMRSSALITPNYGEAKLLTGFGQNEKPTGQQLAQRLEKQGVFNAVITMGAEGALVIERGKISEIPAFSCGQPVDTTGAGDTFNGVLTAALAMGKTLREAVCEAAVAAGIGVTRPGAAGSIPTKAEVETSYKEVEAYYKGEYL